LSLEILRFKEGDQQVNEQPSRNDSAKDDHLNLSYFKRVRNHTNASINAKKKITAPSINTSCMAKNLHPKKFETVLTPSVHA